MLNAEEDGKHRGKYERHRQRCPRHIPSQLKIVSGVATHRVVVVVVSIKNDDGIKKPRKHHHRAEEQKEGECGPRQGFPVTIVDTVAAPPQKASTGQCDVGHKQEYAKAIQFLASRDGPTVIVGVVDETEISYGGHHTNSGDEQKHTERGS